MARRPRRWPSAGADLIDLNMGCPVPKVCKTGAARRCWTTPTAPSRVARAARGGSGLPVTVKLRSGRTPGDRAGVELARRLVDDAGVAGIALPPAPRRPAPQGRARLRARRRARRRAAGARADLRRAARRREGARRLRARPAPRRCCSRAARWATRGCSRSCSACATASPTATRSSTSSTGSSTGRCEHFGPERAGRYLRKFYPWYVGAPGRAARRSSSALMTTRDRWTQARAPSSRRCGCLQAA